MRLRVLDWPFALLFILGGLMILMVTGMPVAFCFILVNIVGVYLLWGGFAGLEQLITSIYASVSSFILLPVPLFILMGEVMFHSGVASRMMDAIDKLLGRLPGRLSLLAVVGGTIFSTLSGASMASVALLGAVLVPEMEKRGYKKAMTLGPILGSSGLAVMIPPSAMAVVLCSIGEISVGATLISIIIPGLLMAALYAGYILTRSVFQPSLAPAYDIESLHFLEKVKVTVKYILPTGIILFLVIGVIFIGIATPSEAASTGAIGTFILAACYRKLHWDVLQKSMVGTLQTTVMVLIIITGAKAFSQILGFSGATRGVAELAIGLELPPIIVIGVIITITLFLGMFITGVSMMMITLPIFLPVVEALGFNQVWFGVIMLLSMEMATTSPPFGLSLFILKGVRGGDTTMGDVYKSALPYLGCDLIVMMGLLIYPGIALWLPGLMR